MTLLKCTLIEKAIFTMGSAVILGSTRDMAKAKVSSLPNFYTRVLARDPRTLLSELARSFADRPRAGLDN